MEQTRKGLRSVNCLRMLFRNGTNNRVVTNAFITGPEFELVGVPVQPAGPIKVVSLLLTIQF